MDFFREKLSEVPHNFHLLPPLLLFLLLPHFLSSNFFAKSSSGRDAERGRRLGRKQKWDTAKAKAPDVEEEEEEENSPVTQKSALFRPSSQLDAGLL